ncbi:MAG: hypothetical protein HYY65_03915 [Candidatus Tectomicrobia bacterium]|uniref:Methanethiol oxidase n=1 Tax=Tectimicrobiota bacterium TaxID=2528274 RepID=A0A932M0T2_UNCTE|nr:hypothetical protein [Candidatus Tectomicrobia bacterium]
MTLVLPVIAGSIFLSEAAGADVVIAEKAIDKWMYHGRVNKLVLSPDGKRLYIGWNGAYVFDTEQLTFKEIPVQAANTNTGLQHPDGSPVRGHSNLALTPDGKRLYVYDYGASAINVVDTQTLTTPKVISIAPLEEVTDFIVSQDGRKLFVAGSHHLGRIRSEANRTNKILVVDTQADRIERVLDIDKQSVVWFLAADDRPIIYGLVQGKPGGGPVVEQPDLVIDIDKGEIVRELYLPKPKVRVKDSMVRGGYFYSISFVDMTPGQSSENMLSIFSLKDGSKLQEIGLPRFSFQPSFVFEDRWIYIMRKQSILLVDVQNKKVVKDVDIYQPSLLQRLKGQKRPDYTEYMVLSKDGKRLYVAGLLFQKKWTPFFDVPPPPVKLVVTIVDAEKVRRDAE